MSYDTSGIHAFVQDDKNQFVDFWLNLSGTVTIKASNGRQLNPMWVVVHATYYMDNQVLTTKDYHVYCPPPNPGGAGREVWFVFLGPGVTADKIGLSTNKEKPWGGITDLAVKLAEQLRPPIPPKSDTIGGHVPDLSGLARDEERIINQLESNGHLDGGDSAHRTGFAAFLNSQVDKDLLPLFESNGIMVRHPSQVPWNNWKNCTRDQLIGYAAGCWRAGGLGLDINKRLLDAHAKRLYTCQDTENDYPGTTKKVRILGVETPSPGDPLGPHDIIYLRICAGDDAAYTDTLGQATLQGAIDVASTQDTTADQNNLILHAIVCGRLKLLVTMMPQYQDSIRYYWSNWRGQPRFAEEFIWVINEELKRY
jgi:hypothetical protein